MGSSFLGFVASLIVTLGYATSLFSSLEVSVGCPLILLLVSCYKLAVVVVVLLLLHLFVALAALQCSVFSIAILVATRTIVTHDFL